MKTYSETDIFKDGELEFNSLLARIGKKNKDKLTWWTSNLSSYHAGVSDLWDKVSRDKPDAQISYKRFFYTILTNLKVALTCKKFFFEKHLQNIIKKVKDPYIFYTYPTKKYFEQNKYKDLYWNEIASQVTKKRPVIFLCNLVVDCEDVLKKLHVMNFQYENCYFIPAQCFLSIYDILWSITTLLSHRVEMPEECSFNGRNIKNILTQELKKNIYDGRVLQHLLYHRIFIKFFQTVLPERIYTIWENQPWEKAFYFAKEKCKPDCEVYSIMPATLPLKFFGFFPSKDELEYFPYPDKIFTSGKHQKRMFESYGNFPDGCIAEGCAIRQKYFDLWDTKKVGVVPENFVFGLATPFLLETTKELIKIVSNVVKKNKVIIRTYPWMNESLLGELPDNFEIHNADELDFFKKCDIMAYSETSMGAIAMNFGIPAIYVDVGYGLKGDPAFECDDLKWIAHDSDGLADAIQEIINENIESLNKKREMARSYFTGYFTPISEDTLKVYL